MVETKEATCLDVDGTATATGLRTRSGRRKTVGPARVSGRVWSAATPCATDGAEASRLA